MSRLLHAATLNLRCGALRGVRPSEAAIVQQQQLSEDVRFWLTKCCVFAICCSIGLHRLHPGTCCMLGSFDSMHLSATCLHDSTYQSLLASDDGYKLTDGRREGEAWDFGKLRVPVRSPARGCSTLEVSRSRSSDSSAIHNIASMALQRIVSSYCNASLTPSS